MSVSLFPTVTYTNVRPATVPHDSHLVRCSLGLRNSRHARRIAGRRHDARTLYARQEGHADLEEELVAG